MQGPCRHFGWYHGCAADFACAAHTVLSVHQAPDRKTHITAWCDLSNTTYKCPTCGGREMERQLRPSPTVYVWRRRQQRHHRRNRTMTSVIAVGALAPMSFEHMPLISLIHMFDCSWSCWLLITLHAIILRPQKTILTLIIRRRRRADGVFRSPCARR